MLTVTSLHACKAVSHYCICLQQKWTGGLRKVFSCLPLSPSDTFCKHGYEQLVESQGEERSKIIAENTSSNKADVSGYMLKFFTYMMLQEGRRWFLCQYCWSKSFFFFLIAYAVSVTKDPWLLKCKSLSEPLCEALWLKIIAIAMCSFFLGEYCTFLLSLWFFFFGLWLSFKAKWKELSCEKGKML